MCTLKISHLEGSYGEIFTVLSKSQKRRELGQLSAEELAQLVIDLRTIPQPGLRPMEVDNLVGLIVSFARRRHVAFDRVMARQFGRVMADVGRFDDTCREAEAGLSLAGRGGGGYTVLVAPSSHRV